MMTVFFQKKISQNKSWPCMWPCIVSMQMGTFSRFRAVFATKTFSIRATFLSILVNYHHKFSAQPEYRVKKKKPKKN